MKLLTFLGTTSYLTTTYCWTEKEKQKTTHLFPVALNEWLQPDQVLVFLTEEAEKNINWRVLSDSIEATPIRIANGASEEELWSIFNSIVEQVQEGDQLTIDITHGFRSLPLLGLLVSAYLKSTKKANVQHLLYGAFEARNKVKEETPVFELTPFLSLFDWMIASDQFLQTGDGSPLCKLLVGDGPIGNLRNKVQELSEGLQLLRPNMVAQSASELHDCIQAAAKEIVASVPPATEMLDHISSSYGRFVPTDDTPKQLLDAQLQMISWYVDRGQWVQALSLAREWLPSLLCVHFGEDVMDKAAREDMELLLNGGKVKSKDKGKTLKESPLLPQWQSLNTKKRLSNLWGGTLNLANLRNDVLHAGFRKNPKTPTDIQNSINEIVSELKLIWQDFDGRLS